ncbi:pre-mRNA-splicing factor SYF2 [Paragonimus westermani]|uniref:Pre-mRNA-splicing factor SYF2 n=1 Tax=Paragonimus westermani TaxID=34504 RepID=A0A5J4NL50_9TREM|nr:pre-mRNA-splicing factor SYF2 [Paragonimus westermani]
MATEPAKREMHLERLRNLNLRRNEARKINHTEVVEEDKRSKLPANWEIKQRRLQWEEEDEIFKTKCAETNTDPERARALEVTADMADRLEAKRRKKRNTDEGFSSYADASHRKYLKLTKQVKPDLKTYSKEKEKLGDLMFPTANTIGLTERTDAPEAVERLAKMIDEQANKRSSYSRRRPFDADADIDYINERNKRYNELLERHYGKYTAEIKQNLERGTAI